ncbi:uncharacterized protein FIBRA_01204 [Fibroporia radiculosa]|uniref:Uncharacterized protein n=1 Tax=Fibroporia radiculosa TaxID=599839 RepID=J4H0Z1_9APHY|nr:uncharacterized protein FIBRA_01204 [Fibroporia radiculosa]CCL99189.1 predicted protein [Fibroporia radiculosa]
MNIVHLRTLSRVEIQKLARANNIKANLKTTTIIELLLERNPPSPEPQVAADPAGTTSNLVDRSRNPSPSSSPPPPSFTLQTPRPPSRTAHTAGGPSDNNVTRFLAPHVLPGVSSSFNVVDDKDFVSDVDEDGLQSPIRRARTRSGNPSPPASGLPPMMLKTPKGPSTLSTQPPAAGLSPPRARSASFVAQSSRSSSPSSIAGNASVASTRMVEKKRAASEVRMSRIPPASEYARSLMEAMNRSYEEHLPLQPQVPAPELGSPGSSTRPTNGRMPLKQIYMSQPRIVESERSVSGAHTTRPTFGENPAPLLPRPRFQYEDPQLDEVPAPQKKLEDAVASIAAVHRTYRKTYAEAEALRAEAEECFKEVEVLRYRIAQEKAMRLRAMKYFAWWQNKSPWFTDEQLYDHEFKTVTTRDGIIMEIDSDEDEADYVDLMKAPARSCDSKTQSAPLIPEGKGKKGHNVPVKVLKQMAAAYGGPLERQESFIVQTNRKRSRDPAEQEERATSPRKRARNVVGPKATGIHRGRQTGISIAEDTPTNPQASGSGVPKSTASRGKKRRQDADDPETAGADSRSSKRARGMHPGSPSQTNHNTRNSSRAVQGKGKGKMTASESESEDEDRIDSESVVAILSAIVEDGEDEEDAGDDSPIKLPPSVARSPRHTPKGAENHLPRALHPSKMSTQSRSGRSGSRI